MRKCIEEMRAGPLVALAFKYPDGRITIDLTWQSEYMVHDLSFEGIKLLNNFMESVKEHQGIKE